MSSKQELRSEETKKSILDAAGNLFRSRGYESVTMREIAKEASCSHTTIYIYFKDKEALLHQLSMPSIVYLMERMDSLLAKQSSPDNKLKEISLLFIEFCLINRTMCHLFFNVKSVKVDEKSPELEINQARNNLFGKLSSTIQACFGLSPTDDRVLLYTRIYYFSLYGIVATYTNSEESAVQLMDRLKSTFLESFDVQIIGIRQKLEGAQL